MHAAPQVYVAQDLAAAKKKAKKRPSSPEERQACRDRRVDPRVDHAAHARRVVERIESTVDLQRLDRLPPHERLDRAVVFAVGLVRARGEHARPWESMAGKKFARCGPIGDLRVVHA